MEKWWETLGLKLQALRNGVGSKS